MRSCRHRVGSCPHLSPTRGMRQRALNWTPREHLTLSSTVRRGAQQRRVAQRFPVRFKPCRAHHIRLDQGFRRPSGPTDDGIGGEAGPTAGEHFPASLQGVFLRGRANHQTHQPLRPARRSTQGPWCYCSALNSERSRACTWPSHRRWCLEGRGQHLCHSPTRTT
jgi:hypothetical protein